MARTDDLTLLLLQYYVYYSVEQSGKSNRLAEALVPPLPYMAYAAACSTSICIDRGHASFSFGSRRASSDHMVMLCNTVFHAYSRVKRFVPHSTTYVALDDTTLYVLLRVLFVLCTPSLQIQVLCGDGKLQYVFQQDCDTGRLRDCPILRF